MAGSEWPGRLNTGNPFTLEVYPPFENVSGLTYQHAVCRVNVTQNAAAGMRPLANLGLSSIPLGAKGALVRWVSKAGGNGGWISFEDNLGATFIPTTDGGLRLLDADPPLLIVGRSALLRLLAGYESAAGYLMIVWLA